MPITTSTKTKKSDSNTSALEEFRSSGGNSPIVGTKKGRRASKNNERETNTTTNNAAPTVMTSQEGGGGGGGGIGGGAGSNNKDDGNAVVPHVVRVTFLGVSGLLAKPPHPPLPTAAAATNGRTIVDTTSAATAIAESSGNSTMTTPTTTQTTSITSSSAAPNHPSLLFPLPSHLRLVASISRSRTARGIPSELSNHLTKSSSSSTARHNNNNNNNNNRGSEKNSSPSGDGVKVNGGSELGTPISIGSNNERPIVQHHEDQQKQQQQVSERYVAIWDDDGMSKRPNSLAFEADLRPSNVVALEGSGGGGRVTTPDNAAGAVDAHTNTHLASTAYAPKSFFITIGLVSDCNSSNDTLPSLQHHQGSTTATTTTTTTKTTYLPTSTFAIPVAFTDLVINGEETLNGKRKQIDLPLSSINSIINVFGEDNILGPTPNNNNNNISGNINLPIIELSTTGIGTKVAGNNNNNSTTVITDKKTTSLSAQMMSNMTPMSPKTKKKSLIKRILSRRPLHPLSSTAATTSPVSTTPISSEEVYSGTLPRSIYELDRPPNVNERALFLDRYGIDDSGDGGGAVLRIGLEVFPRGSELERIFRQKKYLRKKYAQAAESSSRKGMMSSKKKIGRGSGDDCSTQYTTNSIDNNALDSPSLMDTLDEESDYYHDNEDGSMTYSESYFTFDDNDSRTSSWDESTMGYTGYTDEFSRVTSYGTYNSLDTYNSGEYDVDEDEEKVLSPGGLDSIKSSGNFFSTLLCHIDTTCGDDKTDTVVTSSSSTVGVGPNFSMDENSITIDNRHMILSCTSSNQQQRKGGSTDDAYENMTKQRTNQKNALMYPDDTSNDNASEPELCCIEISPDDIADVEDTSLTIAKQTTPLPLIMQCISDETFQDKNVVVAGGKRELKEEGHELTLEDHVSSSM